MKTVPLPPHESERLAALARYHILDTPPEAAFDELTRLACQICATPIAMMSLVDRDRQWFKSKVGWESDQIERDRSICAHAIVQSDLLMVPDLAADERFAHNPMVTGGPQPEPLDHCQYRTLAPPFGVPTTSAMIHARSSLKV